MARQGRQWARTGEGFTLLELLLVLTILGLVLGLSTANLRATGDSSTLKAETRKLLAELRGVRARAIAESVVYSVEAMEEGRGYLVLPSGEQAELPEGISLAISRGARNTQHELVGAIPAIRFYPDGSTSGGVLVLAREGQASSLAVNWMTGEISLAQGTEVGHATEG